jgi:hypothetical protein
MKRLRIKAGLTAGLCLFGNMLARPALADPSAADRSMAAQLFEEGRVLLDQGRIDQACPKLEESQQLDPGGGTLLNVALCHEKQGRTATAWVEFVEARGIAKADNRPLRVGFAETHIAQLEPALSRVVVQVPASSDVPDLEIRRDGSVVGRAAWGTAVPVDPGDHLVEATAPGKILWRQSVVVAPGTDIRTVAIPPLQDAPAAVADAFHPRLLASTVPPTPPDADARAAASTGDSSPRERTRALTTAGWIALGVSVAAAGVSTYFSIHALSLKKDADRECPGNACSAQGVSTNSDAIRSADLATAMGAVGIAGLGAGVVLLVMGATHPASHFAGSSPALTLTGDVSGGAGRGEMVLRGRW